MPDGAASKRRGPTPNPDRGTPSGYRVSARTRFELGMAQSFLGTRTLQETIDVAVHEFLERLRTEEGFESALSAAEASQQRRAGVAGLASNHRTPPPDRVGPSS